MKQVSHSVYYEMTDKNKQDYQRYISDLIEANKDNEPLYKEMLTIVNKKVKHYKTDFLVHDFNKLTLGPESAKYIWNVYDCGTRLITLDNLFLEDAESSYEYFETLKKGYFSDTSLTFYIDIQEQSIKSISTSDVIQSMFTNYYGSRTNYVINKINTSSYYNRFFEIKSQFDLLMTEFKNYPSKQDIDALFEDSPIQESII